jgi:hypothetical protein
MRPKKFTRTSKKGVQKRKTTKITLIAIKAKDNIKILDTTKMTRTDTTTDKLSAVYCPIYLKEIVIVERWYNDYIDRSLAYFAKK